MNVLLNVLAGVVGGQLTRARAFMDRFDRFAPAHQLTVLKERSVLTEYRSDGSRVVIDVPIGVGKFQAVRRALWENTIMPRVVARCRPDVYLTFSNYVPRFVSAQLASVVGISNLAPFSREAWRHEHALSKLRLSLLRRQIVLSAGRATRVIALSDTCRAALENAGVPANRIAVASNGVESYWAEPSPSSDLLARHGVTRPFLLYVSHFYRYKNHVRLVDAYARVPATLRAAHQMVLVGSPRSQLAYYREIQERVHQLGLGGDVILIPGESGDRIKELYQRTKLFVFPSLIENSPNILLEAMMAGVPVLASRLPPMPEFGGDAIEYFDPLDADAMSASIANMLIDTDRLKTLATQARARARMYTWDEFVVRVLENLDRAVSEHRGH